MPFIISPLPFKSSILAVLCIWELQFFRIVKINSQHALKGREIHSPAPLFELHSIKYSSMNLFQYTLTNPSKYSLQPSCRCDVSTFSVSFIFAFMLLRGSGLPFDGPYAVGLSRLVVVIVRVWVINLMLMVFNLL